MINNAKEVTVPVQKLPKRRKTETWEKSNVDYYISKFKSGGNNNFSRQDSMKKNYDLYNGVFSEEDMKHVTNPYNIQDEGFPVSPSNFNIIFNKINLLLGEETKRPFNMRVVQKGSDIATKLDKEKKKMLLQYVRELFQSEVENREPENQMEPEQIEEYINKRYKTIAEMTALDIIRFLEEDLDIKTKLNEGWKDALIADQEIYYVGHKSGEPVIENINPLYFDYDKDPDLFYIDEGRWATRKLLMSPVTIYDKFHDKIDENTLNDILDYAEGRGGSSSQKESAKKIQKVINIDANNPSTADDIMATDLLTVWHVTWKSYVKIGYLTYVDEAGEEQMELVTEDFDEKALLPGQEIEWDWAIEVREGYKVGEDTYFGMGVIDDLELSVSNPNSMSLPYTGLVYNNRNSISRSLVDMMAPLQYLYITVWYRIELAMARDKGKVPLMDVTQIPKSLGITTSKFLHHLQATGIMFFNPYEEGWKGVHRGGSPSSFNQFKSMDLTMGDVISQYILLLNKVEERIGELTGITEQREGAIASNELVGNVERSVVQSSLITEPLFYKHGLVKKRVYNKLLKAAQTALIDREGEKLQHVLSDGQRKFIEINEDFLFSELGIFATDSSKDHQNLQALQQLLQPAMQNGASLYEAGKIIISESINEILDDLKEIDTRKKQAEEAIRQQELQVQENIANIEKQIAEEQMAQEDKLNLRDNETKLKVAILNKEDDSSGDDIQLRKIENDKQTKQEQINETKRSNRANEDLKRQDLQIKKSKPTSTNK